MKSKTNLILLFFLLQFFVSYFFQFEQLKFFLLAEAFCSYLLIASPYPILVVLPYFFMFPSETFISLFFIFAFHFFNYKVTIHITFAVMLFLILYFFASRYEIGIVRVIMPGFMAFVSIVFAITRVPALTVSIAKSVFVYTVCGFVYGVLYGVLPFFNSKPFLMFPVDVIQIIVAFFLYTSFGAISMEKPDNPD